MHTVEYFRRIKHIPRRFGLLDLGSGQSRPDLFDFGQQALGFSDVEKTRCVVRHYIGKIERAVVEHSYVLCFDVERDQTFLGLVVGDDMRSLMQILIAIGADTQPSEADQVTVLHGIADFNRGEEQIRFEGIAYQLKNVRLGQHVDVAHYRCERALGGQRVATVLFVKDVGDVGAAQNDSSDQVIGHLDFHDGGDVVDTTGFAEDRGFSVTRRPADEGHYHFVAETEVLAADMDLHGDRLLVQIPDSDDAIDGFLYERRFQVPAAGVDIDISAFGMAIGPVPHFVIDVVSDFPLKTVSGTENVCLFNQDFDRLSVFGLLLRDDVSRKLMIANNRANLVVAGAIHVVRDGGQHAFFCPFGIDHALFNQLRRQLHDIQF